MTNDEIIWIYIIDNSGATIFSYENFLMGNSEINHALLSHFIHALQSMAKNLEEEEIKEVIIGENRFYLSKEALTNYLFIVKTKPTAKYENLKLILKKIKDRFVEKFTGHFTLPVQDKLELIQSFKEDVKKIIEGKNHLLDLVETLSKKN
ncbi:MAG: hypothetical protein ACFE8N_16215 [Promethearchaeota archaeon]